MGAVASAALDTTPSRGPSLAADLDRRRTAYCELLLSHRLFAFTALLTWWIPIAEHWRVWPLWAAAVVAVLYMVLVTAARAGFRARTLALLGVLLLLPVLNLVTLMIVDFRIADTVERLSSTETAPRTCRLAYWSVIMSWLPPVGLPMAIVALYQIGGSRGLLTGRGYAIAGVVCNAIVLTAIVLLVSRS